MQEDSFNEEREKVNHLLQTYLTRWHFHFMQIVKPNITYFSNCIF